MLIKCKEGERSGIKGSAGTAVEKGPLTAFESLQSQPGGCRAAGAMSQ